MSRSGYSDECEYLDLYRATVARAIDGKRGQAFLREMAVVLDAMPEKALIVGELIAENGACCAIGAVCKARAIDVSKIDCENAYGVGKTVGISTSLAAEIAFINDERGGDDETPARRWQRMREWVMANLETPTGR